jgi:hypothetical protein
MPRLSFLDVVLFKLFDGPIAWSSDGTDSPPVFIPSKQTSQSGVDNGCRELGRRGLFSITV